MPTIGTNATYYLCHIDHIHSISYHTSNVNPNVSPIGAYTLKPMHRSVDRGVPFLSGYTVSQVVPFRKPYPLYLESLKSPLCMSHSLGTYVYSTRIKNFIRRIEAVMPYR